MLAVWWFHGVLLAVFFIIAVTADVDPQKSLSLQLEELRQPHQDAAPWRVVNASKSSEIELQRAADAASDAAPAKTGATPNAATVKTEDHLPPLPRERQKQHLQTPNDVAESSEKEAWPAPAPVEPSVAAAGSAGAAGSQAALEVELELLKAPSSAPPPPPPSPTPSPAAAAAAGARAPQSAGQPEYATDLDETDHQPLHPASPEIRSAAQHQSTNGKKTDRDSDRGEDNKTEDDADEDDDEEDEDNEDGDEGDDDEDEDDDDEEEATTAAPHFDASGTTVSNSVPLHPAPIPAAPVEEKRPATDAEEDLPGEDEMAEADEGLLELMVRIAENPQNWRRVHEQLETLDRDLENVRRIQDSLESQDSPVPGLEPGDSWLPEPRKRSGFSASRRLETNRWSDEDEDLVVKSQPNADLEFDFPKDSSRAKGKSKGGRARKKPRRHRTTPAPRVDEADGGDERDEESLRRAQLLRAGVLEPAGGDSKGKGKGRNRGRQRERERERERELERERERQEERRRKQAEEQAAKEQAEREEQERMQQEKERAMSKLRGWERSKEEREQAKLQGMNNRVRFGDFNDENGVRVGGYSSNSNRVGDFNSENRNRGFSADNRNRVGDFNSNNRNHPVGDFTPDNRNRVADFNTDNRNRGGSFNADNRNRVGSFNTDRIGDFSNRVGDPTDHHHGSVRLYDTSAGPRRGGASAVSFASPNALKSPSKGSEGQGWRASLASLEALKSGPWPRLPQGEAEGDGEGEGAWPDFSALASLRHRHHRPRHRPPGAILDAALARHKELLAGAWTGGADGDQQTQQVGAAPSGQRSPPGPSSEGADHKGVGGVVGARQWPHFAYHRVTTSPLLLAVPRPRNAYVAVSLVNAGPRAHRPPQPPPPPPPQQQQPPQQPEAQQQQQRQEPAVDVRSPPRGVQEEVDKASATTPSSGTTLPWSHARHLDRMQEQLRTLSAVEERLRYRWLERQRLRQMMRDGGAPGGGLLRAPRPAPAPNATTPAPAPAPLP